MSTPGTSPQRPPTTGRCGPGTATRLCNAGSASKGAALWRCRPPAAVPPLWRPEGDPGAHERRMRQLAAPLAPLPPGGTRGGPPPPARGQSSMGGLVALCWRCMDRSLLLRAGAGGSGGADPRHSLLHPAQRDHRGQFPPPHAPAGRFRVGASQSTAGATPPQAPKRGSADAPMAHCGREQLPPPSPAPWQGLHSLPPCSEWHPGVPAARGPPPVPGPAGGFLEAPTGRPLPAVDHLARLHDRMKGPYSGRGVGAQMGPVARRHARPIDPRTTVHCRPP